MKRREVAGGENSPSEVSDEETPLPATCIVLQIAPNTPKETLIWLTTKIRAKRPDGGGELIVMKQLTNPDEPYIFHISASKIKFLEVAEEIEMIKTDRNGLAREFSVSTLEEFLPEDMNVDDLFTLAERQSIVRHELENIRAMPEESQIPGYKKSYKLYEGQSILQALQNYDIITKVYPLHDEEDVKKLGTKWYLSKNLLMTTEQPTEEIRLYFGESIALYFTFLGFYTKALFLPMVLGFLQLLLSKETLPFYCIFNVVWVTLFLEVWKRKSSELAYKWGTISMTSLDEPRPYFRGAMGIDAVTGKVQPQSPRYMTTIKMYAVSLPVVILCMIGAFIIMLLSFWAEDYIKQYDKESFLVTLPSVIYTVLVLVMNAFYRKLATFLTEWENHRTQSQFERHRVTKLVLFEFVNSFLALFYIAFITRDMDMLRSQLQTMFITSQGVNNLQEVFLPLIMKYYSNQVKQITHTIRRRSSLSSMTPVETPLADLQIPQIAAEDPRAKQAILEGDMEQYEDTYDDYLELFIQFGFAFLFSSVYPIAAFYAVLNNILEIRADAFKLCRVFQRPFCRQVKDIGAWQRAFEVLGGLSIMTNCGLLYLSPKIRSMAPTFTDVTWLLMFIGLEHGLLGLRYLLHIAISDKPEWVRVALARKNYQSKQALKFERAQKNRKFLTRRFKTVHGPHAS